MIFANYAAFRTALLSLLEGDDIAESTFSTATADLLIGLGESRVYNGDPSVPPLRASCMVASLSVVIASNAAALPADLLELKELYFSGDRPLEIIPLDRLRAKEADHSGASDALYAAQDGDTLRFWPVATGTVLGRYYKRPTELKDISDATWAATALEIARYPELFIYACLIESAGFLGFDDRAERWQAQYQAKAWGAQHSEQARTANGPPLRIRAR